MTIFRSSERRGGTGQPLDSDLTAIAALTTQAVGRGLLDDADQAALRTSLGLGTAAVEAASATKTASTVAMWDGARDLSADDLHLEAAIDFSLAAAIAPTVSVGATGKAMSVLGGLAPSGFAGGAATVGGGLGNGAASGLTTIGRDGATPGTNPGGGVALQAGTAVSNVRAGVSVVSGAAQILKVSKDSTYVRIRAGTGDIGSGSSGAADFILEGASVSLASQGGDITLSPGSGTVSISGTIVELAGQLSSAPNAQAFTATPLFNFATGNHQTMGACTADVTALNVSNPRPGAVYTIKMLQDAGGARTVTGWDSDIIFGATYSNVLVLGANRVTVWMFVAESATQIRCIAKDDYAS